jgi:hypothetical protein
MHIRGFRRPGFGAFQFAGHAPVEEDQRVQVAVAGVKDIGDAQPAGRG